MKREGLLTGVVTPILLSVVPGWGHIWVHRPTRGIVLFALFFAVLDVLVIKKGDPERIPFSANYALAAAAAIGVFTLVDILRLTLWTRSATVQGRRSTLLRRLVTYYLRGELGQAEDAAERLLRVHPADPALLFWRGMVARDSGTPKTARRYLLAARAADRDLLWRADLDHELEVIQRKRR